MRNCLIVCDGELNKKQLSRFISPNKPRKQVVIIACDGASDFLLKNKVIPDYIIGDLDGINPKTLAYYRNRKVIIKKIADQNSNDLEKALRLALTKKFKRISIIGFSGKRFDHSLNNLSILKRYYKKADIRVYDNRFEMYVINRATEFASRKGDIVSLIPLPEAIGIKTVGLKYPLNNESLNFGIREGALNEATDELVKIKITKGELLVFRKI